MADMFHGLDCLEHAGVLDDLQETPACLLADGVSPDLSRTNYSCAFCGIGDSGLVEETRDSTKSLLPENAEGVIALKVQGQPLELKARLSQKRKLEIETRIPLASPGGVLSGEFKINGIAHSVAGVEDGCRRDADHAICAQNFNLYDGAGRQSSLKVKDKTPSAGCAKFNLSMGFHKPIFPYQISPSALDNQGKRIPLTYQEGIARFADLLLEHRPPEGRTLVYCSGQADYFAFFAFQDVLRLLGIRSMTGNGEHCVNSTAVHNQILTGQEGPYLTLKAAIEGPDRFYLMNGWNGMITHSPVFHALSRRKDFDGYVIECTVTATGKAVASKIGAEKILLVKPGSDPHLALAVAHQILAKHSDAIEQRFIDKFSDEQSWRVYREKACSDDFVPATVASRIAALPKYESIILNAIYDIAEKIANPKIVPINIPSMGHSQSKGIVGHCLWGNVMAMVGKLGLKSDSSAAGGTLRLAGQINAQSEVQGFSAKYFMGRIPITKDNCIDAARRLGLPDHAYNMLLLDKPRAALDFSEPNSDKELFICMGTQFEANMPGRRRWLKKLADSNVKLIVIDPIADPYTMKNADLILAVPPHSAVPKLMQNGEWRMFVSVPRKKAPAESRSDATIIYDVMAEISKRLRNDEGLRKKHPDLGALSESGYLQCQFESPENGGRLHRLNGEVSRPQLWKRIQRYLSDGEGRKGPLYCRIVDDRGRPFEWKEVMDKGSFIYGGVGSTRYRLDYEKTDHQPFADIFCKAGNYKFFVPTESDLAIPEGPILITGRGVLLDDKKRIQFATSTFNSGKATTAVDMPEENLLHISHEFAASLGVKDGGKVKVTNRINHESLVLTVFITDRVKGTTVYCSFHKAKAELERDQYINDVTDHEGRCPYTGQTQLKNTLVTIEPVT